MTWMKVDDGFWSHPKTLALPPEAVALWVRAGSWAAQQLTDGAVRRHVLRLFGASDADAQELVDAGLWEADADGWRFHDWLDYQPSKAKVEAQREWDRRRMELHRDKHLVTAIRARDQGRCRYCGRLVRWNSRRGADAATYDHVVPRGENSLENVVVACGPCNMSKGARTPEQAGMKLLDPGELGQDSVRSKNGPSSEQLPDPTRPLRESAARPAPAARPHSLPPSFSPSTETRTWAEQSRPEIDLDVVCAKLVATHAASGKTSGDWQGVLRTWVLNERVVTLASGGASVVDLDAYRPAAVARPASVAWCGSCEEYDRRYEDEAGRWHKCEVCHPAKQGEPAF